METYLPNSIKEVNPSAPKIEGTNIFDITQSAYQKDDKWAFPDKDMSENGITITLLPYTGQQGTLTSIRH